MIAAEKYGLQLNEQIVASELQKLRNELPALNAAGIWKHCFSFIDLTTLNATDTEERVKKIAEDVNNFPSKFPGIPNVAAICVYPSLAHTVRRTLMASEVRIAAVGAGFPGSQTFIEIKCDECRMAVEKGANEIDIVISLGTFLSGDHATVANEIKQIKAVIGNARLKVILETGVLSQAQIADASFIVMEAGADFIKTSTGKIEPAATPEAAWVMVSCIKKYYEKTGKKIGFKPAGGIVTSDDAMLYYAIVKKILGDEWLTPSLFRLGASRLANNLLTDITGNKVCYF